MVRFSFLFKKLGDPLDPFIKSVWVVVIFFLFSATSNFINCFQVIEFKIKEAIY